MGVTILHLDIDALLELWLEQMGKPGLTCDVTTNTADIVDNAYLYYTIHMDTLFRENIIKSSIYR